MFRMFERSEFTNATAMPFSAMSNLGAALAAPISVPLRLVRILVVRLRLMLREQSNSESAFAVI